MHQTRLSLRTILLLQVALLAVLAVAYARMSPQQDSQWKRMLTGRAGDPVVAVPRNEPLMIEPLYDERQVVSDDELAAVLKKLRPKFTDENINPNYVEHALRTWGVDATFAENGVLSGAELRDFLVDKNYYIRVYGLEAPPLLLDRPRGVSVRWGFHEEGGSVHHDHLLASLTEAGITLDQPVYPPSGRRMNFEDVLQEALRDFQLDEIEVEWTPLAAALWLPPETTRWRARDGRTVTFDLLARRLMRGHKEMGVCSGTHRVYTLAALWRLDERFDHTVLSPDVSAAVWKHLETVRDLIIAAQLEDGRWPASWPAGTEAASIAGGEQEFQQVISTGHHLEWLAIAPRELHPPQEAINRAADWVITTTLGKSNDDILRQYTFYSHIANALALWRGTQPADFWRQWIAEHPDAIEESSETNDPGNALLPPPPQP